MTKSRKSRVLISVLVFVVLVGALQLGTGVFDFIPRLRAQATSPDGALTVKIYQKRLMPGPLFPRMGAVAKVFDSSGHLVHEDLFFRDSDFDNTLHDAFKQIVFEGEEIVIGPGFYDRSQRYIIRRSDWKSHWRSVPAI